MHLVLKTAKTFFLAKTRNRHYRINTSISPCPQTHTPLRYACGSSGSRAAHSPPPGWDPPLSYLYPPTNLPPIPPPPPTNVDR